MKKLIQMYFSNERWELPRLTTPSPLPRKPACTRVKYSKDKLEASLFWDYETNPFLFMNILGSILPWIYLLICGNKYGESPERYRKVRSWNQNVIPTLAK